MAKFCFQIALLLIGLLLCSPPNHATTINPADVLIRQLQARVREFPENVPGRLKLAQAYFRSSGLEEYCRQLNLLATEPLLKRHALLAKLPKVQLEMAQQLREEIIAILELDPENGAALVLAGKYHWYNGQKDTARWYFERAINYRPADLEPKLVLAELYLYEYQPDKALVILKDAVGPLAALRTGQAYLQLNEYQQALYHLINAQPLAPALTEVRQKELLKAYIALGEANQALELDFSTTGESIIGAILRFDLKGWAFASLNDLSASLNCWCEGKKIDPAYQYWDYYYTWILRQQGVAPPPDLAGFADSYYNSFFKLWQSEHFLKKKQTELAYLAAAEAIKNDRRSLVGFLAAGNILYDQGNYGQAIGLFEQGLAINPEFLPFWQKRLTGLRRLDRAQSGKTIPAISGVLRQVNQSRMQGFLAVTEQHQSVLYLKGETKNLVGVWLGIDGNRWLWYPWWGGPLLIRQKTKGLWVIPVGPDLSGLAFLIEHKTELPQPAINPPLHLEGGLEISSDPAVKMVGVVTGADSTEAFMAGEDGKLWLPIRKAGEYSIRVNYQTAEGFWGTRAFTENFNTVNPVTYEIRPRLHLKSANTNSRLINFSVPVTADGRLSALEVSYGEEGDLSGWMPYRAELALLLSDGDGAKKILVKVRDQTGGYGETESEVYLDTAPPQIVKLEKSFVNNIFRIEMQLAEAAACLLRTLDKLGNWSEIAVQAGIDGKITGVVSLEDSAYFEILLTDGTGNTQLYVDPEINLKLAESGKARFNLNQSLVYFNSNPILIKNLAETTGGSWAVSADTTVWTGWQAPGAELKWRVKNYEGLQFIFVKSYCGTGGSPEVQILPIIYDHSPPEIIAISSPEEFDAGWAALTIKYNEAVKTRVRKYHFGKMQEELEEGTEFNASLRIMLDFAGRQANSRMEIEAVDRGGNISKNRISWVGSQPVVE